MPSHDTFKNDRIPTESYTDLAGNTVTRPGAGELEIGPEPFLGQQARNIDGSLTPMPAEGSVLSRSTICDICGKYIERQGELVRNGRLWVCKECIDEPGR